MQDMRRSAYACAMQRPVLTYSMALPGAAAPVAAERVLKHARELRVSVRHVRVAPPRLVPLEDEKKKRKKKRGRRRGKRKKKRKEKRRGESGGKGGKEVRS
eukprot:509876-Rhodomonas_salina.1